MKTHRIIRSDLNKPKSYKKRNWTNYDENGKKILETVVEKIQKPNKASHKKVQAPKLERTPAKDILDISTEEQGFYRIGDRIINIEFPR